MANNHPTIETSNIIGTNATIVSAISPIAVVFIAIFLFFPHFQSDLFTAYITQPTTETNSIIGINATNTFVTSAMVIAVTFSAMLGIFPTLL